MTTWKDYPDRIETEHGTLVLYGFKPQFRRLIHDDRRDDPPAGSEPLYRFLPHPVMTVPVPANVSRLADKHARIVDLPGTPRRVPDPTRLPDGKQRFPFPHLAAGPVTYGVSDSGYRTATTPTACGRTVAATLTTHRGDLVRCEDCIAAADSTT